MRIEVWKHNTRYHNIMILRCDCGRIFDILNNNFVFCRNCGKGYYLASPEGNGEAKSRYKFAIRLEAEE